MCIDNSTTSCKNISYIFYRTCELEKKSTKSTKYTKIRLEHINYVKANTTFRVKA